MAISDKEVGELWRAMISDRPCQGCDYCANLKAIIRKLVEERARWRYTRYPVTWDNTSDKIRNVHRDEALRDFGIDPATFKESSHG